MAVPLSRLSRLQSCECTLRRAAQTIRRPGFSHRRITSSSSSLERYYVRKPRSSTTPSNVSGHSIVSRLARLPDRQLLGSAQCHQQHISTALLLQRSFHTSKAGQEESRPPRPTPGKQPIKQQSQLKDTSPRITERLVDVRERTKEVTNRVKSSITKLTPHENIYNVPNLLTVSRLFAAPLTAYLVFHDQAGWALAVFAYAGITDLVDGWMARKWKLQTVAGSVIDPMADKALMIIVTVTLAVKAALPAYLATLILGRDASLAIAAIWYRYASLPAPRTIARYWDFSLPSAEVHPTTVSKYNTFLQLVLIGSTLALPVITSDNHHLGMLHDLGLGNVDLHKAMLGLQILVAATTAWSGLSYAFLKDAVTIIGSDEKLKARQGAIGRGIIGVTFGAVVVMASYLAVDELESKQEKQVEAGVDNTAR